LNSCENVSNVSHLSGDQLAAIPAFHGLGDDGIVSECGVDLCDEVEGGSHGDKVDCMREEESDDGDSRMFANMEKNHTDPYASATAPSSAACLRVL
jgi:hypothetical protein